MSAEPITTIDAALAYVARGLAVMPCAGKLPRTEHGQHDASSDLDQVRAWCEQWPTTNLGMPMRANGLIAVDVDPRNGGYETLAALETELGPLPRTCVQHTGGGGLHIVMRDPGGDLVGKLGDGIDLKANGYIIVEPSIHPETGKPYEWTSLDPSGVPEAWLARMRKASAPQSRTTNATGTIAEGGRNAALASLAGRMRSAGMSVEAIEAALLAENARRCNPPLDDYEVSQIANSVGRYEPTHDAAGDGVMRAWGEKVAARMREASLGATDLLALAPSTHARTTIMVRAADQMSTVSDAERALASYGGVYVRGRQLVRVVRDRSAGDWLRRPQGMPVIEPLPKARLGELLGAAAEWRQFNNKGEPQPAPVPSWVTEALIARGEWSLPAIEGVTDAPVLRADGSILDVAGYDSATRLIYAPGDVEYPPVPSTPTRDDSARAFRELLDPFADFPFVADSDRAATVAMVLSIIGRSAIDGCVPMFASCAPTPGSGKGLLIDAASIIATGRAAPKMAPTDDDDETRKRLLAIAMESPPIVLIDNVEGSIGSPALAMALTAGEVRDRILGSTRIITATLRPVWALTGNNVQLRGDLGRRVVPIDIDPRVEHPEDRRGFRHVDLLAHVRSERPQLVTAALTLLRAFVVADRPSHGKATKGSFEAWDRLVRGAIVWASGVDPLGGVERIREAGDSDLDNLRTLLAAWRAAFGDRAVSVAEAVDYANNPAMATSATLEQRGALRDALAPYGDKAGRLDARALGYSLRKLKGRVAGALALQAGEHGKRGMPWRVITAASSTW